MLSGGFDKTMTDRNWLLKNLPHQGKMNLLDTVKAWDADTIHCTASSHQNADNPLRDSGRLGISAAIEYAAQAMAAHGRLLDYNPQKPSQGFIASLRDIRFSVESLDNIGPILEIKANRLMGNEGHVIYEFSVSEQNNILATGRATVILDRTKIVEL